MQAASQPGADIKRAHFGGARSFEAVLCVVISMGMSVSAAVATSPADSPLILVSIDGFRWDYPELYAAEAGTIRKL